MTTTRTISIVSNFKCMHFIRRLNGENQVILHEGNFGFVQSPIALVDKAYMENNYEFEIIPCETNSNYATIPLKCKDENQFYIIKVDRYGNVQDMSNQDMAIAIYEYNLTC